MGETIKSKMIQYKKIPYYETSKNLTQQLAKSSKNRGLKKIDFLIKKTRNYIFQTLAYNCPLNSLRVWLHKKRGVHIGKNVMIGMHCVLDNAYPEYIYIDDDAALAGHVYILAHSNPYKHFSNVLDSYVAPVRIRKGVWVGVSVTILSGADIGEYSIVTAGSVVTGKMPDRCFLRGNPAREIAKFKL